MPRSFLPEHIQLLKQTMIPRAPACIFTDDDIAILGARTGLDAAQVRKWAVNLRLRVEEAKRLEFLQFVPPDDAPSTVSTRSFFLPSGLEYGLIVRICSPPTPSAST